ncbi:hypothetical protein AAFC00_001563 [Neodothiora populina]|uniref:CTLH domain-containing protein n=1 Tax=Neodothiora populina TaxID=2781224 RepID=A0ABR3PPL4_9PEZI
MSGHVRNTSDVRRVAMPRRSTKGPLDMEEEESVTTSRASSQRASINERYISAPTPPTPTERTRAPYTPALNTNLPPSPASIPRGALLSPDSITSYDTPRSPSPNVSRTNLDLSILLRPNLYQSIPTTNIPPPFLSSQPPTTTTLPELLAKRHFRLAADKVVEILCQSDISPYENERIFELFHTRLACLILTNHADLAAKECRPLLDIVAKERRIVNPIALIPWDLRLLIETRLRPVLAHGGARRSIMNLYSLGTECRINASRAEEDQKLWTDRLADLGLRVASVLVEMGETETALRHLNSLDDESNNELKALLYLRLGDV